jgi:sterol desaturase/sphingolipid hydroxylase (fatty acid hydroxylase superfamily)
MLKRVRAALRGELEAPASEHQLGSGWVSGVFAFVFSLAGLAAVLCMRYPELLTAPEIRSAVSLPLVRVATHVVLIAAFSLAAISLILRESKILGLTAIVAVLIAIALGGSMVRDSSDLSGSVYFGLDWFVLNLLLTGILFVPLERLFPRRVQPVFRTEWREDLFYFFIASILIQSLTLLSLAPSRLILATTQLGSVQKAISGQPVVLQFLEIMVLTDFVQYWVHRIFHRVPFLWRFHAVHHSAQTLDWLAGSRMHLLEVVCLRGFTVIPMYVLGFSQPALYAYLVVVYLYATYVHSNLKFDIEWLKPFIVTPRFHHWHHGIEKEAVDVNFAVHFPLFDRLFGTYYMPPGRWPSGYGVSESVPGGFLRQLRYPFMSRSKP